MTDHERSLRLLDFDCRSQTQPESVYFLGQGGGAYLPIHPFADEPELLAKLHITPDNCRSVDAYWRVGDDVCFLQVWLAKDDALGRSGLFARWSDGEPPMLNVVAVVNAGTVCRKQFEDVMLRFLRLGAPSHPLFNPSIGDRLVPIEEKYPDSTAEQ